MASVMELQAELAEKQEQALELSVRALDAIDKINAQASFWISILAIGIAVVALVGFSVLWVTMLRMSKKVAESKISAFLTSDKGAAFVRKAIQHEVRSQIQDRTFVFVNPLGEDEPDEPFPEDPKRDGAK